MGSCCCKLFQRQTTDGLDNVVDLQYPIECVDMEENLVTPAQLDSDFIDLREDVVSCSMYRAVTSQLVAISALWNADWPRALTSCRVTCYTVTVISVFVIAFIVVIREKSATWWPVLTITRIMLRGIRTGDLMAEKENKSILLQKVCNHTNLLTVNIADILLFIPGLGLHTCLAWRHIYPLSWVVLSLKSLLIELKLFFRHLTRCGYIQYKVQTSLFSLLTT